MRKTLVIAAVAFAIAAPAVQAALDLGLSPAEFAAAGNSTLRAAGYAFAIWSLIYAGLVAYAVWQALPRNDDEPLLGDVAGPSIVAIAGSGLWICASALDWRWASVGIIVVSAASLTLGLMRASGRVRGPLPLRRRIVAWWPLCVLAGWLTIAAALNILTVLTAEGVLAGFAKAAAFSGVIAVLVAALLVLRAPGMAAYGAPVAWGLAAVWAAEKATKGDVAALAMGAAILVGAYAAWQARPSARPR